MKKTKTEEKTACHSADKSTPTERTYARACIILLALNFCLTGYVLLGMFDIQEKMAVVEPTPIADSSTELLSTEGN